MLDLKKLCYEYFITNEITSRDSLIKCWTAKPLKDVNFPILEGFYIMYCKDSRIEADVIIKKVDNYRVVSLSDWHIPFEEPYVLDLVYQYIYDMQPNEIILNGDILDLYGLSKYTKTPTTNSSLKQEIDKFLYYMEILRTITKCKITFIKGNHENRLEENIKKNIPGIYECETTYIPNSLQLNRFDIDYCDVDYVINDVLFYHGKKCSNNASYTAKAEFDKMVCNGVSGHTHRLGTYFKKGKFKTYFWLENGCLCTMNPEYEKHTNWQHGFVVMDFIDKKVIPHTVPILDGVLVWGNKVYDKPVGMF